jgi:hypothetical protein
MRRPRSRRSHTGLPASAESRQTLLAPSAVWGSRSGCSRVDCSAGSVGRRSVSRSRQGGHAAALLFSHHGVVESIVCEPLVARDARVPQRGILVATERENRLVHLLSIEHLQAHEKMEVLHRQAGDG